MLPTARDGSTARAVSQRCAEAARAVIMEATRQPRVVTVKGTSTGGRPDIVTATDPAVERAVTAILTDAFPEHDVLGEETGAHARGSAWRWIIDPIDGTNNFNAGAPWVGFNLALWHEEEPRLALTLDPYQDELFYAESGGGTTLNGEPVHVSSAPGLARSLLGIDLGMDDALARRMLDTTKGLFPGVQALRVAGTVALGMAYVAAGRWGAYAHPRPAVWDFAPGVLLVREAGGVVTDFHGAPATMASRSIIAGPPAIHAEALATFSSVLPPP